jgi:hypothetical protein
MAADSDRPIADATIETHRGLFVLRPQTPAALAWLQAHAAVEAWQWIAGGLCIDGAAYARELVAGMTADGLTVVDAPGGPSEPAIH